MRRSSRGLRGRRADCGGQLLTQLLEVTEPGVDTSVSLLDYRKADLHLLDDTVCRRSRRQARVHTNAATHAV